jgi:hypothetical protein
VTMLEIENINKMFTRLQVQIFVLVNRSRGRFLLSAKY